MDLKIKVKGIDGEEHSFNLVGIDRRKACEVSVKVTNIVGAGLLKLDADAPSPYQIVGAIATALDWETVQWLIPILFDSAIINKDEKTTDDLFEFFGENPDLLYRAIFEALKANYPKLFARIPGNLASRFGQMMGTTSESGTA